MSGFAKRLTKWILSPFGIRRRSDLMGSRPVVLAAWLARRGRNAIKSSSIWLLAAAWQLSFTRRATTLPPTVCFISHIERQCGIHEFGNSIAQALRTSTTFRFVYVECSGRSALVRALLRHRPVAVIYNHHPSTMPWMSRRVAAAIRQITGHTVRQIAIIHECPQSVVDGALADTFDYYIAPDPTLLPHNPIVFKSGRLIPSYVNRSAQPEIVTVGSLGFGGIQKRYDLVVQAVQREFDRAVVRINIAYNGVADVDGVLAREAAERCRNIPKKEGIDLEITHHFYDQQGMLDFLAGNTLNAFFYDWQEGRGISAVVESALAVGRPLVVNRTPMFRHVWEANPSICIDDTTLREVIRNGTAPLRPFLEKWSAECLRGEYESIVSEALKGRFLYEATVAGGRPTRLNRILDDDARALYDPVIRKLFLLSPDVMRRKIPEANVQQAFVLDTVQSMSGRDYRAARILCVGCYEDSAFTSLRRLGYNVMGIDPAVNYDLRTFSLKKKHLKGAFDIVFSTSVLEHVPEDEEFMSQTADLLKQGGYAVMTCDFNNAYRPGDRIPLVDQRLYTERDLYSRLLPVMRHCVPVDTPDWNCPDPDFTYEGCQYTFATLTVQKRG